MQAASTQRGTLPALLSMMVGGFAIGTTEYASVGVLPQIADDFGVNLARVPGWSSAAMRWGSASGRRSSRR